MEENNNENKKITKKQIITMSIGVSILIVLAITATYAFFRFGNNNAFGTTKITAHTPGSNTPSVVLENVNSEIKIELATEDMIQPNGDTTYWASPDGKTTTETVNQLGRAKALLEGTYTCNYTMAIEDKAEDSIYEAFQGMSNKSNNQIVLKVNEETYDFNQSNLFPITYNGILEGITQSDYQYITTSMSIKNDRNIDQTVLANKNIDIEYKVTELNCSETGTLQNFDFFIGGKGNPKKIYIDNGIATTKMYLGWKANNIEKYCVSEENNINRCEWIETNGEKEIRIDRTFTGEVGDTITLYGFIKDSNGNISKASNSVILGNSMAEYIMAMSKTDDTIIEQVHDTGESGTKQTGHNTDVDYRYIGQNPNNYVCLGNVDVNGSCESEDRLYRIIGVLNEKIVNELGTDVTGEYEYRVKLIKNTAYIDNDYSTDGKYYWTGQRSSGLENYQSFTGAVSNPNNWVESTLNRKILNGEILNSTDIYSPSYYASLGETYQNMIANTNWYLGGASGSKVDSYIISERSKTVCSITNDCSNAVTTNSYFHVAKVGLMYATDYLYATSGNNELLRNECLELDAIDWENYPLCSEYDWLTFGRQEWTMQIRRTDSYSVRRIRDFGRLTWTEFEENTNTYYIRPVIYLNSNTYIVDGEGTQEKPYTLG